MTRRRFFVPRDLISPKGATLPPLQAHHLRDVLRMHSGDQVEIFDGFGSGYTGEIEVCGSEVHVRALKRLPSENSLFHLTLAAALVKTAKFEWMLEKATELGVDEIVPLKTCHSEIRIPPEKMGSRLERWRRIAREAARQCERLTEPLIREPLDFAEFLSMPGFSGFTKILFYEKCRDPWQLNELVSNHLSICIGPEGGWTTGEIEQARASGYQISGLGPRILRAETAAIAAVSIVQYQIQLLNHNSQFLIPNS